MIPRVAMINMKGGVSKTTLAVNIAFCAAKFHHKKVLLVDADPQFNATQYLMTDKEYLSHINDPNKCTIYDIFFERADQPISIVTRRPRKALPKPNARNSIVRIWEGDESALDLAPSKLQLMELETIARQKERRLAAFLDQIEDKYDLIIIDCPPTISVFTLSAYLASNAYLVPLKPDPLSVIGLPLLETAISQYSQDSGHTVDQVGLVFTMVRKTRLMRETMEDLLDKRGDDIFDGFLSFSTYVAEAVQEHKALTEFPRAHRFGEEIKGITGEFMSRLESGT